MEEATVAASRTTGGSKGAAATTAETTASSKAKGAASGKRTASSKAAAARSTAGPRPDLKILETRVLRGPNYWSRQPVVKMLVDLGSLEDYPSTKIPGFVGTLVEWIPSLEDHACSLNRRGGFITRLGGCGT